ncbi:MAG: STT3 domain-containing protein [Candidatus Bathycorpusculaceae bacterium]
MGIKGVLSKERIVNGIKGLGKLRVKASHGSVITFSALLLILFVAFTVRVLPLRWEIQTGSVHLSEFDPYYQYSLTRYMVQNGLISPYWPNFWVDRQRWYPDGINMGMSYPALPMTAAVFYNIISLLGVNVDLMEFCAIFPAIMGTLACLLVYFVGKDIQGKSAGLFAALFLALTPSFVQRTSLGFFDDETIGIVALLLFVFTFLRAIEEERPLSSTVKYSLGSAAALAYFCTGWGAAFYPIGLTVIFVFALILLKRYNQRLLLSYSLTFGLGLFLSINVPYVSTRYLLTAPIILVAGMFVLLSLFEILRICLSTKSKVMVIIALLTVLICGFTVLWQLGYMQSIAGKFISVINPLARAESPLIESVAEHRISAWGSIYYELGIGILFFIAGLYFTLRNPNNKNLFLLIFGLTSLYFACSMVRLLVLLAPAFSLLASIGVLGILKPFYTLLRESPRIVVKTKHGLGRVGKEFSGAAIFLIFLLLVTNFAFAPQSGGVPKVYGQAYAPVTVTAGSLPISPNEPVQEWLNMLDWTRSNLDSATVVCSWWDYGYWLSLLGNVTSLADNATINSTQIENVGFIFMANETQSLKMLEKYNAKYILVFTTLSMSQSGNYWYASFAGFGDEGKWMWMARISGKARDRFVNMGLLDDQSAWTDETTFGAYNNETNRWEWGSVGKNSTIYKLMSWGKQRWCEESGYIVYPDESAVQPEYFKEAYFAGLTLSPYDVGKYGGIVPLVCLYEIDWQQYYSDYLD